MRFIIPACISLSVSDKNLSAAGFRDGISLDSSLEACKSLLPKNKVAIELLCRMTNTKSAKSSQQAIW